MELNARLDQATLNEKAEPSIVPIDVGLRANRTFIVERQRAERAEKKKGERTTGNGTTETLKLGTSATQSVCSSNSVLGLNFV